MDTADRRCAAHGGRVTPLADAIRPDARATLTQLQQLGIEPVIASGDRVEVVADVAQRLGGLRTTTTFVPKTNSRWCNRCSGAVASFVVSWRRGRKKVWTSQGSTWRYSLPMSDSTGIDVHEVGAGIEAHAASRQRASVLAQFTRRITAQSDINRLCKLSFVARKRSEEIRKALDKYGEGCQSLLAIDNMIKMIRMIIEKPEFVVALWYCSGAHLLQCQHARDLPSGKASRSSH